MMLRERFLQLPGTYNDGDEITLTATNNFGYEFVEWQVGNTGTVLSSENPYTFIIDGDISIKAVYNAKNYLFV